MFTNKARLLVISIFLVMLVFFIYQHTYELAAVVGLFVVMLIWGYFKEGPIILAAKHFHNKNYAKAEALLLQISNPNWLSKKRRGFYEFIMGSIAMHKQDFEAAELHYELAAQFPLRTVNDHVAALVHVANISIRNGKYDKAQNYLQMAKEKEPQATAKMKSVISQIEEVLKKHQ
ncbi:tetratricopeptide repeat protein [Mucilaginibacter myungsuensis]|uniref:Tetratricopeptide repeat protein n=1 Tax=Mucilaginibacter myungsuensis TaxID=649104 RepID=A0A929KXZ5_9SPHI|nr:tetratricopeptide repeat protein [Mucilaginibacter myungsuensis]MBE9662518.1 tetratricopeptide repeat protein [Mucilaginibacter myungsuensis]MDN3597937.1 tetratricopeptide repeat protein [Mucilaginibacter myungsuensis]